MGSIAFAVVTLACALGGAAFGMFCGARLPAHRRDADSRDSVKMAIGVVSTLTALVLGFLVASAKNSFDAKSDGVARIATDTILLDQAMARYGPETSRAREMLREATAERISQTRPGAGVGPTKDLGADVAAMLEVLQRELHDLRPATDAQRALQSKALALIGELTQTRWLTLMRAGRSAIPTVYLVVLVFWLTVVFAGIGVLAPRNATVVVALVACAMSVAAALFLILELDSPYSGVIVISDAPLRIALEHLGR